MKTQTHKNKVQVFWKGHTNLKKSPICFDVTELTEHLNKWEIFSNFVAFSQYLNFDYLVDKLVTS